MRHLRRWGAVYILALLFLGSWLGQFLTQMVEFTSEQEEHGQSFAWSDFLPTSSRPPSRTGRASGYSSSSRQSFCWAPSTCCSRPMPKTWSGWNARSTPLPSGSAPSLRSRANPAAIRRSNPNRQRSPYRPRHDTRRGVVPRGTGTAVGSKADLRRSRCPADQPT